MSVESPWPYLEKRFPAGQFALLQEVSDAAGFGRSRSADGIAMSLWPSRGLGIDGIEIKSYRSDWLRELKHPEKADQTIMYLALPFELDISMVWPAIKPAIAFIWVYIFC